jgi:TrmH family RNA methyltransferase
MVESLSKAKQKWLRSLQLKKNRDEEKLFVVEGEKMVLEGLEKNRENLHSLIVDKAHETLIPKDVLPYSFAVTSNEMEQLSSLKTPNKLIAVFKRKNESIQPNVFGIVLDGIQDPGNLGTILRLADWFGIQQIICSHDTVEVYNPKVIQASMGAIFRVAVHYTNLESFLTETNQPSYAAMLSGEHYKQVMYPANGLLVMGNEGKGIRPEIERLVDHKITIPRLGEAESLNVSTATAILLAEMKLNGTTIS